jgi:hypothetical protein
MGPKGTSRRPNYHKSARKFCFVAFDNSDSKVRKKVVRTQAARSSVASRKNTIAHRLESGKRLGMTMDVDRTELSSRAMHERITSGHESKLQMTALRPEESRPPVAAGHPTSRPPMSMDPMTLRQHRHDDPTHPNTMTVSRATFTSLSVTTRPPNAHNTAWETQNRLGPDDAGRLSPRLNPNFSRAEKDISRITQQNAPFCSIKKYEVVFPMTHSALTPQLPRIQM